MAQLRASQFVGADSLDLIAQPRLLLLIGDIGCLGGIFITVEKYLEVCTTGASPADVLDGDHDIIVQTIGYSYYAGVQDHGMILRYDDNHPWPGHPDCHHVHRGDWRDREDDRGHVTWVGADRWPTLGAVIEELRDWYYAHIDELPERLRHEYA